MPSCTNLQQRAPSRLWPTDCISDVAIARCKATKWYIDAVFTLCDVVNAYTVVTRQQHSVKITAQLEHIRVELLLRRIILEVRNEDATFQA